MVVPCIRITLELEGELRVDCVGLEPDDPRYADWLNRRPEVLELVNQAIALREAADTPIRAARLEVFEAIAAGFDS